MNEDTFRATWRVVDRPYRDATGCESGDYVAWQSRLTGEWKVSNHVLCGFDDGPRVRFDDGGYVYLSRCVVVERREDASEEKPDSDIPENHFYSKRRFDSVSKDSSDDQTKRPHVFINPTNQKNPGPRKPKSPPVPKVARFEILEYLEGLQDEGLLGIIIKYGIGDRLGYSRDVREERIRVLMKFLARNPNRAEELIHGKSVAARPKWKTDAEKNVTDVMGFIKKYKSDITTDGERLIDLKFGTTIGIRNRDGKWTGFTPREGFLERLEVPERIPRIHLSAKEDVDEDDDDGNVDVFERVREIVALMRGSKRFSTVQGEPPTVRISIPVTMKGNDIRPIVESSRGDDGRLRYQLVAVLT